LPQVPPSDPDHDQMTEGKERATVGPEVYGLPRYHTVLGSVVGG